MEAEAQHPVAVSWSRWHSLDRRLPLLISTLLAVTVAVFAAGAYYSVREVLLAAAAARMEVAARQLSSLLHESAVQRLREIETLAADAAVRDLLGERDVPAARAAAAKRLAVAAADPQTVTVRVRAADGSEILVVDGSADLPGAARPPPVVPTAGVSLFQAAGSAVFYDLVAPVPVHRKPPGWLVTRRRISSANSARALAALIGSNARLLVGNARGDVWTDFTGVAPAPAGERRARSSGGPELRDDGRHLAVVLAIAGTPWQVALQTTRLSALAPARAFLGPLAAIALAVVLLGAIAAWLFSRRITGPLDRLTVAAAGLAAGNFDLPLPHGGRGEVGRLAAVFETMRQRIVADHQRLELRVKQRTAELRDTLTKLEQAQAELVRAERLAILGQLASSVGHELRNPLAVMTNGLFYLEMVLGDSDDEVREYLGILRHEIRLSEKIVSDLLDFARLKPPQRERVQLGQVVDEQLHRLGSLPSVRVEWQPPPDLPAVLADPVQIGQIFLNLAVNAAQAMGDKGGVLRVEARAASGDRVELVVRDQGPGVPEALRERIFEPLFTTKARGIGLGLAVSRRLAENNGGELVLLDGAGPGAAFALQLTAAGGERR